MWAEAARSSAPRSSQTSPASAARSSRSRRRRQVATSSFRERPTWSRPPASSPITAVSSPSIPAWTSSYAGSKTAAGRPLSRKARSPPRRAFADGASTIPWRESIETCARSTSRSAPAIHRSAPTAESSRATSSVRSPSRRPPRTTSLAMRSPTGSAAGDMRVSAKPVAPARPAVGRPRRRTTVRGHRGPLPCTVGEIQALELVENEKLPCRREYVYLHGLRIVRP